jgi:Arc/MetJ-type ribon-helix-helix transcriptional regulator
MEEETTFVNIKMPSELLEKLNEMVADEESDRSKFIRKLIRQEYARRQQLPLFPPDKPEKKTNPKIRSARAEAVAA